jgi:hypothetical protein
VSVDDEVSAAVATFVTIAVAVIVEDDESDAVVGAEATTDAVTEPLPSMYAFTVADFSTNKPSKSKMSPTAKLIGIALVHKFRLIPVVPVWTTPEAVI